MKYRNAIIGTILGDASLTGVKNKALYFGHSEQQKEYLDHKAEVAIKFAKTASKIIEAKSMTSPSSKRKRFFKFFTKTHYKYTSLFKRIYINGEKRITDFVLKQLNAETLAYLFMDDGCNEKVKGKTKSYKFSISNFPLEDIKKLRDTIYKKFKICSKIYLDRGKYPILKIQRKEDKLKFEKLLKPYIIPSMQYKIIYT